MTKCYPKSHSSWALHSQETLFDPSLPKFTWINTCTQVSFTASTLWNSKLYCSRTSLWLDARCKQKWRLYWHTFKPQTHEENLSKCMNESNGLYHRASLVIRESYCVNLFLWFSTWHKQNGSNTDPVRIVLTLNYYCLFNRAIMQILSMKTEFNLKGNKE